MNHTTSAAKHNKKHSLSLMLTETCRAVVPSSLVVAWTLAPFWIKSFAISTSPRCAAMCNAVSPLFDRARGLPPSSRNFATPAAWPEAADSMSGVAPLIALASTDAPLDTRKWTISRSLPVAAACSA
eukprot:3680345-Pleurochrysis_carterae.AAC.1